MPIHSRCRTLFGFLLCVSLIPASVSWARGLANFENFTEGDFFFPSFVDPVSGISFVDSTGPDPGEWVIEFVGVRPQWPTMSPGNYLVSVGYAPGPVRLLPNEFGFTAILPQLSNRVTMTMGYATDPAHPVIVEGFDSGGTRVAMSSYNPVPGSFIEMQLAIESPAANIQSFKVTPNNIFTGYDNIEFLVPEPAACAVLALFPLTGRRRSKSPR